MLEVIILRILDLSITKYFNSLKERFQKETLYLRVEDSGNFEGAVRIGFKGNGEEDLKITEVERRKDINCIRNRHYTSNEIFYGINQENNLDGVQSFQELRMLRIVK